MKIGIVGLGYVGLPLAIAFCEAGHEVVGVDTDPRVADALAAGRSHVEDVPDEALVAISDRFQASSRYAQLAKVDAIIVAVPTPLTRNREPDLQPLIAAGTALAGVLQDGQLVVLESTTYPGTTRDQFVPLLEESGLAAGRDFHAAFSPERIDPGRTDYTMRTTPKVVGGLTDECRRRAVELYSEVCDEVVEVSTPEAAELTKLLENVFRSVNIALVNELAILCDRMGIDIWEVTDAAATKPYGFMSFKPGPGMGGHCLPVDPFYLAWRAREFDMQTEFIELAGEVNQRMPYFCVERIARALNDHSKSVRGSRIGIYGVSYKPGVGDLLNEERTAVNGARVLLIGVAYKADVSDMRESPALDVLRLLDAKGADLRYHDPYVPELALDGRSWKSVELTDEELAGADLVVVLTDHSTVDWARVVARSQRVYDTRNATRGVRDGREKIRKL
ncbi:MAG TPA: nucleotide sugar dehydrogenase [Thermoleophilaceae bacterium]|nr:nucleotide sugar dehydrogenase [Thermoleophilaceae bacterium]